MFLDKSPSELRLFDEEQYFLETALHDIRAHLRGTGIAAELLSETSSDRERVALEKQILHGLSQTGDLLAAIGRYAAVLTPNRYRSAVFPAASAVGFAMANLESEIRQAGATVVIGDLPEIAGDRQRIADLFEYLLGNALKFRGTDPPSVELDAKRVPEGWIFAVKDNGIGIPAKYRDRLFYPFRRLHGADVPGAGLGLATARKIVEAHGGRIWIEGAEAGGVTICALLPAADGDALASRHPALKKEPW